jgi:F-type H+-transporting ATPase subunit a
VTEKKTGPWWRKNRYLVLILIILSIYFTGVFPPVRPHIQLPAEPVPATIALVVGVISVVVAIALALLVRRAEMLLLALWIGVLSAIPFFFHFEWTNTMVAVIIADIILMFIAYGVYKASASGKLVPSGFSGAVEALLEVVFNMTEGTAGKWAKSIFPWFATITLLVLVVNWMELIPGVDSIGYFEHIVIEGEEHGTYTVDLGVVKTIVSEAVKGMDVREEAVLFIPFVRVASTDLNFTLALAVTAVIMVQVMGVRSQGGAYFKKFFNTSTFFSKPIFGIIDFFVGILELVSEFSKILSFTFRLFGNIFAGSVLLFVMGSLLGRLAFLQTGFLMLEFFVGMIQALVFGLLTMTFMAQATQGHGGEHQEEAH